MWIQTTVDPGDLFTLEIVLAVIAAAGRVLLPAIFFLLPSSRSHHSSRVQWREGEVIVCKKGSSHRREIMCERKRVRERERERVREREDSMPRLRALHIRIEFVCVQRPNVRLVSFLSPLISRRN